MLVEVKAKVSRVIDSKTRKTTETYLIDNVELFSQAEYRVMSILVHEQEDGIVENFELQSLRLSPIKEVATQFLNDGEHSFIAALEDIFTDDAGNEKHLRYNVLLWADSLTEADSRAHSLARQGYNMLIQGIRQADYIYQNHITDENSNS